MMILRPLRLAEALGADELSERDKFQYLLLGGVAGVLLGTGAGPWGAWTRSRVISLVLLTTITVIGLIICFRANARGDNRAFLERYLCLSALVGMVSSVIYYALYYGLGVVGLLGGWIDAEAHGWNRDAMSLVAGIIAAIIYYLWLRKLLVRASGVRTA